MNVELRLPPEWGVSLASDGTTRATSESAPGVEITTGPFTVIVDRKMVWARSVMCERLGVAPASLELVSESVSQTEDAWPSWFVVVRAHGSDDTRVFAFYHFLDYSSFAMIRGPGATAHADLLRRARPNYATTDVVALEQLWE